MNTRIASVATFTALVVLAGACGDEDTADAPTTTMPATTMPATTMAATTMPATTMPTTTRPEVTVPQDDQPDDQPEVVRLAIEDLVARTGADPASIDVARHESVTWRDGSIGCPEPGMSYTMALVPGYRIELVLDGESHWYHGARDRPPSWCANPSEPLDGPAGDT